MSKARAGLRIMTRHGRRPLPAGQEDRPGPDRLALLHVGGEVQGLTTVARGKQTMLVAALPDGTAVSWNVRARREWGKAADYLGTLTDTQMPEQVAAELDAALTGLEVVARQATAVARWIDALFEAASRKRTFTLTDFADLARCSVCATPQVMDVTLTEDLAGQQVLFAQLSLESLSPARRDNQRTQVDREVGVDGPRGRLE